ncbi:MAG: FAD-dependent oxidoreductase [Gammaproteobacteria bacterium]|nr:FAD-dependent oxidoreductase [Gammaproteobacteria bacterium]
MGRQLSFPVVIVGAGPVGLCLAMDLAARGIEVGVFESRHAGEPPSVKCNHVASRTMETFRRLGFVDEVRKAGLPDDYPNDVVFRTRATGYELTRIPIPNRLERYTSSNGPDTGWPTPEPPHRINQIYLEPILFKQAAEQAGISIYNRSEVTAFEQGDDSVVVTVRNLENDDEQSVRCQYLIGCDGGHSRIRRMIGASLQGDAVIQRVQSTCFRAPTLLGRITGERAWMSYLYNPERAGNLVAIDGREVWLLHNYLLPHETDFNSVDRDACIRLLLGVGEEFEYEELTQEDWIGRRLVADRFRAGRVFICGDAAHLWVPYAGYGMNAGIADAMNLSWLLAGHLNGWAPASLIENYQTERQPITEQVSRFAMRHAESVIAERTGVPAELEDDTPAGAEARRKVGDAAYALNVQQFACAGLNYGYYYDRSPLIAYDDEAAPGYTMHDYTPSTVPGCRVPHFQLPDGRSLYDAVGPWFTLLKFDRQTDTSALQQAFAELNVPFELLDIDIQAPPAPYRHRLLLCRPDLHVAWRGDQLPADAGALVRQVSGNN